MVPSTRAIRAAAIVLPTPPAPLHSPDSQPASQAVPALVLADRNPDPFGGRGHVDMIDFIFAPQALDDGIGPRRTRTHPPGLAGALDPQRIGRAGHVVGFEHEGRAVGGAW